jgi:homoserine kinase type II
MVELRALTDWPGFAPEWRELSLARGMYQIRAVGVQKRIEFPMAALTPLSLSDARELLGAYDDRELPGPASGLSAVAPVLAGTVNSSYALEIGSSRVFVRIYEEQDDAGARGEARRLEHLAARGVRTPAPTPRRDGAFVGTMHGKPVVLFPWREGRMRCLATVTPADAYRVGVALAELHRAGRDAPRGPGRFEPSDLELRLDRLAVVPFPDIAKQAAPLRAKLASWVAKRDTSLPRGLVHGDLFRDNVLWGDDGEISALLDFESASSGTPAYDLMVTLLAWSFRDALDEAVARALVDGYETVRPLDERERAGLLAEGCIAAIRFTITRLTDAELRAAEAGVPPRRDKDWRRFAMRLATLERLGSAGLDRVLWG